MMKMKAKYLKGVLHVVGITVLAVLFARFVVYDLMSMSVFSPMEKATDFQMSDVYQSVAESKAVHQLSEDVTIVALDGYARAEVLDAINLISEYAPAAIGLDIFFPAPEKENDYLLTTLSEVPGVVCAAMVERDAEAATWHRVRQSFFEDSIALRYGFVNLNASSSRDVIRQFTPYVLTAGNDTLLSLPAQLVRQTNGKAYRQLVERGGEAETIAFEHIEFPVVPVAEVLNGEADERLLSGKVILMGDVKNSNDSYLSPLHAPLPGIMLHAYALQTVLSGNYIDTTPTWLNWLIAIVLCLLFACCNMVAVFRLGTLANLFVRIVQFGIIYVLIVIGSVYFASHHSYIDFSPAILMIGFGAVAFDIWFGVYAVYQWIIRKVNKTK